MGETTHSTDTDESDDQGGENRSLLPRGILAGYGLLAIINTIGIVRAPPNGGSVGSQICGTTIAQTINALAPLILAVVIFGGGILCYILHAYSGFKKDPQKVKEVKGWRNRAGYTAVTAPLVGKFIEIALGTTGLGLAGCIDIIPVL